MGIKIKMAILLSTLGTMLEVYDFLIYSLLANYLTKVFFTGNGSSAIFIETFIVFSVGYLCRPLGGIIIGSIGDRLGRKKALAISLQGMALPTLMIGLLPSYHTIGSLSVILLMLFRVLQGFAYGAELPGALTYVVEFSKKDKQQINSSFVSFGGGLGGILSTTTVYVLTKIFSDEEIIAYAWRIPFLIGGLLSLLAIYFRLKATESPKFDKLTIKSTSPVLTALKVLPNNVFIGISITILPAMMIILGHYLPAYLRDFTDFPSQHIYFSIMIGTIVFTFSILIFGFVSSFIKNYIIILIFSLFIFFSSLTLLLFGYHINLLTIFVVGYKFFTAPLIACYPYILTKLFPTQLRYSGVAISHNFAFTISALLLFFTTSAAKAFENPRWVISLMLIISLYTIFIITSYYRTKMNIHKIIYGYNPG